MIHSKWWFKVFGKLLAIYFHDYTNPIIDENITSVKKLFRVSIKQLKYYLKKLMGKQMKKKSFFGDHTVQWSTFTTNH